jgi:hypothetical protein
MYEGKLVFAQLMDHLPMHTLRRTAERFGGDRWVKTVSTPTSRSTSSHSRPIASDTSPTFWRGSTITRSPSSTNSCPGTGNPRPQPPPTSPRPEHQAPIDFVTDVVNGVNKPIHMTIRLSRRFQSGAYPEGKDAADEDAGRPLQPDPQLGRKRGIIAVFQRDAAHTRTYRRDYSLGANQRFAACLNWPAEPSEPPSARAG